MRTRRIINVVSGKGGTGKTLFCAVLADLLGSDGKSVLVIDLDVFVRGLTALLYYHKGEAVRLVQKDEVAVVDLFMRVAPHRGDYRPLLGISRYRSFDVLPSVSEIDQDLHLRNIIPDTRREAELILQSLIHSIPGDYELIFLDSRAGYDELIAATHTVSDITLVVEEDDPISQVTADTLVKQLRQDAPTALFRVTNKARSMKSVAEMERSQRGILDLGSIPFDGDVMRSFGSISFWDDISRSLYRQSLAAVWNRLAQRTRMEYELPLTRLSPIGSTRLETQFSAIPLTARILFIYSSLVAIGGFVMAFGNVRSAYLYFQEDPLRVIGLSIGVIGLTMMIYLVARLSKR